MTHPSLIAKPALTVADMHLIGKLIFADAISDAEGDRLWEIGEELDDYLVKAVGDGWENQEALVP